MVAKDAWPRRLALVWLVLLGSKCSDPTRGGVASIALVAIAAHVLASAANRACLGRGAWASSLLLVACAPYVEALAGPAAGAALALTAHAALVRHGQAFVGLAVTGVAAAGVLALGDDAWPLPLAAMALPFACAPTSCGGALSLAFALAVGLARGNPAALEPSDPAGLLGTLAGGLMPGALILAAMRQAHARPVRPFAWRTAVGHGAGRAWALACGLIVVEALCCGARPSLGWAGCLYGSLWLGEAATDAARAVSSR